MSYLDEQPEIADDLAVSLDYWNLSSNLMDDLEDWKADLRKHRFTYLLTTAISELGGWTELCDLDADGMREKIGKHIYCSGLLDRYLTRAISYLDVSAESATSARCQRWASYINMYKCLLVARQKQIASALQALVVEHTGTVVPPAASKKAQNSSASPDQE